MSKVAPLYGTSNLVHRLIKGGVVMVLNTTIKGRGPDVGSF